ncbi:hypothetical protein BV898_08058 [Hypsibius exemplaris]|uniref:Uncharacterized protein n=1 Tax=Hypsibius exemplaris TaxID=2072580 RepID=A0A1W0WRW5_HYPEX|nr:hypothetical protein BV898_08058 [Hypsibius exemplaris]
MDYNHQLYDSSRLNYQTRSPSENHNNNVGTNGNGGGGTRRTGTVTVAGGGANYSQQGPNGQGNDRQILKHPALKRVQNLRRNSIQRKIYEHQLREAETTKSVNQALVQARPITQGHLLTAPSVPTRKLSSSTPNLSLISESEQFLGPPQSYGQPRSPMRSERSHSPRSPRMSPYPLSPASSSSHLADYGGGAELADQTQRMHLSSPVPSQLINGSPSQPSYLNRYQQNEQQMQNQARNHLQQVEQYQQPHQTQPQQQSMNLGAHNGTNAYSSAIHSIYNHTTAHFRDNKHTTGQAAQAASQMQLTFGGTMVHPPFNAPVESVSFNIIQAHANQNEAYQQQSTYQIQSGFFNQNAKKEASVTVMDDEGIDAIAERLRLGGESLAKLKAEGFSTKDDLKLLSSGAVTELKLGNLRDTLAVQKYISDFNGEKVAKVRQETASNLRTSHSRQPAVQKSSNRAAPYRRQNTSSLANKDFRRMLAPRYFIGANYRRNGPANSSGGLSAGRPASRNT